MPKKSGRKTQKKKQKSNKPLWLVGVGALVIVIGIAAIIRFVGDAPQDQPPPTPNVTIPVNFYFPAVDTEDWEQELRQIPLSTPSNIISAIVNGVFAGPEGAELESVAPEGFFVESLGLSDDDSIVSIHFPSIFEEMSTRERTNLMVSLVYTLTGLAFVDGLMFYINGEPMLDGNGKVFGLRHRENTTFGLITPPPTVIVLYFPDEQMTWLVRELRNITYDPLVGIESRIVDALIEGPRTPGLSPALPAETLLHRPVHRSDYVVFVDFTADFLGNFSGGSTAEEMMIFSLVNSLTEIYDNKYVQILVDGLAVPHEGAFHMDLSRLIERDESLILQDD